MNVVTLYTKPGCHLCEAIEQTLRAASEQRNFDLVIRNIDDSTEDHTRYRDAIPVVTLNGREIARYRISRAEFDAALQAVNTGV